LAADEVHSFYALITTASKKRQYFQSVMLRGTAQPIHTGDVRVWRRVDKHKLPDCSTAHVHFSNRPFGVKHFQTIRRCSVDVAHGLVVLFGIGISHPFLRQIKARQPGSVW
jgi:hypothetical protein